MITKGTYSKEGNTYIVYVENYDRFIEVVAYDSKELSAFKIDGSKQFAYSNMLAKEIYSIISKGLKGCKSKSASPVPCELGVAVQYVSKIGKTEATITKYNNELMGFESDTDEYSILLEYSDSKPEVFKNITYIELQTGSVKKKDKLFDGDNTVEDEFDSVPVRSLMEISLEKDITWLKEKKYYVVNDDATAEKIFEQLDKWNGPISYDTETTGLKINMFSKINSKEQKLLEEYNRNPNNEKIRADRLVGIIFSVQPNVSYYFPCFNRKFANLYDNKDSEVRNRLIQNIKADYTVGKYRDLKTDMAEYWRNTEPEDVSSDCLLMERVRFILTNKSIIAHHGSFEWKVSYCYDIVLNLEEDTMLLHQILYKFRSTTSNKGEPSDLKSIVKREFGIDQLELSDFFMNYKEDDEGEVRRGGSKRSKKSLYIDFSYMDYEGTRAYAPADGDLTLQIYFKYKQDLLFEHKEQEYIYKIEVVVACAIGYMEFYGIKLDENKIAEVRKKYMLDKLNFEAEIMKIRGIMTNDEQTAYNKVLEANTDEEWNEALNQYRSLVEANEGYINLASPQQVAKMMYVELEYPYSDKMSVGKKVLKSLSRLKDEDGNPKYPVVNLYQNWKLRDTMLSKFFDNLPKFMYLGGFIFPSFGQISTATGRMSCKHPNAQQFPDDIKKIVVPRDDCIIIDADYSQIEYRTLVAMAKEGHLLELFKDPDNDYHTLMASLMYSVPYASVTSKMRSDAKSFNFGIPYGMGYKSLAILLTGMSGPAQVEEAKQKYELYFRDQPNVKQFFARVKEGALVNGYTSTHWNRYRFYSFLDKEGKVSNKIKAAALRQAGNAVIQGTAADIFKIAVARMYTWIRQNSLIGSVFIINMIHDEMLMEVNIKNLNSKAVLRDIINNMGYKVEGFPPLFVGAGVGMCWKDAKGKMAEIHPDLAEEFKSEANGLSLYGGCSLQPKEVVQIYQDRVNEFRRLKVKNYLEDSENFNKDLHPAIGNLINLQFTYGLEKELSGDELTNAAVEKFIEVNGLSINPKLFMKNSGVISEEPDTEDEYTDGDEEDMDLELVSDEINEGSFALIEENESMFGVSLQDIISEFGLIVYKDKHICGIDINVLSYKKQDVLYELIENHICKKEDEDSLQVVFLLNNNVLKYTGVYINNIEGSELSTKIGLNTVLYN